MRFLLLLAVLSSCASKPTAFNYADSMKRETPKEDIRSVKSTDGLASYKAEAGSLPKMELNQQQLEFYYSAIDIGSAAPLECTFYKTDINPASSLKRLANGVLNSAQIVGTVTKKEIAYIDAGEMNGTPFLQMDTSYLTSKNGVQMVGYFKSLVAIKGRDSIVCWHNDLGFKDTFRKLTSQVVSSYEFKRVDGTVFKPTYSEVLVFKVQNRPIGFSTSMVLDGNNESKIWINRSAILAISHSISEVSATDDSQLEVSGKNGMISLGKYAGETDLEVGHVIDLNSQDGRVFHVKGIFKGKDISSFMKTSGLVSNYQQTKMASEAFFKDKKKKFTATGYVPSLSPVKPIDLHYTLKELKPGGAVVNVKIGEINSTIDMQENGTSKGVVIPIGPVKIEGTKVYEAGAF